MTRKRFGGLLSAAALLVGLSGGVVPAQAQAAAWLAESLATETTRVAFARDTFGRPQLQPPLHAHDCNWSHSGEGLLVAVGEGLDLGVDLEWRRPRPRRPQLPSSAFSSAIARLPVPYRTARAASSDRSDHLFFRVKP